MKDSYKILGIDPGTNIFGYAILEIKQKKASLITLGVFNLKNYKEHQTKLKEIYLNVQEIIETYLPQDLAVEAPFYGKNVQSMLKLGRAQGVAMAAAITMGLKIKEYSPKKIKQSITGNGNASKEQVAAMLNQILNVKISGEHLDATDALAAAVCHHNQGFKMGNKKTYGSWTAYIKDNPKKVK